MNSGAKETINLNIIQSGRNSPGGKSGDYNGKYFVFEVQGVVK